MFIFLLLVPRLVSTIGVCPAWHFLTAYPWLWYHLSSNVISPEKLVAIGEVTVLKHWRQEAAGRFVVFRYSVTLAVVWDALDKSLRN